MTARARLGLLTAVGLAALYLTGCVAEDPAPSGAIEAGAVEAWTPQQLRDFLGRFGFTQMPVEQTGATADGVVTLAELEQAMGRVEDCYEDLQPGHDLTFRRENPDPESGQPAAFAIRIASGSGSADSDTDDALAECEERFSHPLAAVFNHMHTDRAKFEGWLSRQTPDPDAETWSVDEHGTPTRVGPEGD